MKLNEKLNNLNSYPFHMPGHKRNKAFGIIGSEIDITEINGFDNLHNPKGVLLDIENRLTKLYGSKKSFTLVNGSTVGILSAVFAVCNEGDTVIIARNCHKSVFNACMLRKLKVIYIEPEFDEENGFYKRITQSAVDKAIFKHPEAKALVITSPTYEGYISEISSPVPLIIDAAHGAHFGLGGFPDYPKSDIVISSLHKTLPALTQTAVANIYNENYIDKFKLYVDIFETSSPSYVLMSSVERCLDYIQIGSFDEYCKALEAFRSVKLNSLRIRKSDDISRIVVSTAGTSLSGTELSDILRKKFNIECEASSKNYVILISTVADDESALNMLKEALIEIDNSISKTKKDCFVKPPCPEGAMIISIDDNSQQTAFNKSVGKTANEFVFAYPPDIPLIVPGEVITREMIAYIEALIKSGVNVISDSALLPDKILTKAE